MEQIKQAVSRVGIPALRFFPSIGSTNDEALAWAEAGAADYSLVVADQQTAGRGRLNRGWVTNPGAALAFSLVLRLTEAETDQIQLFSPLAGLAVCRAMEKRGLPAEIKWPNDVLLARRKTCGILVESSWQGDRLTGVVVGIGINVAPGSIPPADQQQFPATCVEAHAGTRVDRWQLLADVLVEFITWRPKIGSDAFFAAWEDRLAFKGEKVTLKNAGGTDFNGILLGVNREGDLRIRLENGSEKLVSVGDVHLRRVGD